MKRLIAAAITLLCVACGDAAPKAGDAAPKSRSSARDPNAPNEPPEIKQAEIQPADADTDDPLSLDIEIRDPERDPFDIRVEWYRNGELIEEGDESGVPAGLLARDDRVYAIVYATSGEHEVSRQTLALSVANARPQVRPFAIQPKGATGLDLLEVEPTAVDSDGDSVALSYQWFRNGQPLPDATTARLAPGVGHRGEQIIVQVNADDGRDKSGWIPSAPLVLGNAAPAITTQPNYSPSASGQYSYSVEAKDPDGDSPLRYELVSGPPGMSVDVASGVVTWKVPTNAKGTYPIELLVSDPFGGKTTQNYSLSVDWSDEPASPARTQPSGAQAPQSGSSTTNAGTGVASEAALEPADEDELDDTDEDQEEPEEEEF